jgi:hypothetical protein
VSDQIRCTSIVILLNRKATSTPSLYCTLYKSQFWLHFHSHGINPCVAHSCTKASNTDQIFEILALNRMMVGKLPSSLCGIRTMAQAFDLLGPSYVNLASSHWIIEKFGARKIPHAQLESPTHKCIMCVVYWSSTSCCFYMMVTLSCTPRF